MAGQACKPWQDGLRQCAIRHMRWPLYNSSTQNTCERLLGYAQIIKTSGQSSIQTTPDMVTLKDDLKSRSVQSAVKDDLPITLTPTLLDTDIPSLTTSPPFVPHCPTDRSIILGWLVGKEVFLGVSLGCLIYLMVWFTHRFFSKCYQQGDPIAPNGGLTPATELSSSTFDTATCHTAFLTKSLEPKPSCPAKTTVLVFTDV